MNHAVERISFITLRLPSMILPVVEEDVAVADVVVPEVKVEVAALARVVLEVVVVRIIAVVEEAVVSTGATKKDPVNQLHAWMMKMTFLALSILRHDCRRSS